MYPDSLRKVFRLTVVFFALVAMGLLSLWLWGYLNKGKVIVTTSDPINSLRLVKINEAEGGNEELIAEGFGKIEERVEAGEYRVSVADEQNIGFSNKAVSVSARQAHTIKLDPVLPVLFQPVSSVNGQDIYVDDTKIWFLSTAGGYLESINSSGQRTMHSQTSLSSVQWLDSGFGVGITADARFYSVNKGGLEQLNTPRAQTTPAAASYSLADNKRLYISIGKDIYSGTVYEEMKKIYTTDISSNVLASSNDKLAIISSPGEHAVAEEVVTEENEDKSSIKIIDKNGSLLASSEVFATDASWSPNGEKIALMDSFSRTVRVVDKDLNSLATLQIKGITKLAWADNDRLILATGSNIQIYDSQKQESYPLTSVSAGDNISQISVDGSASYVYFISGLRDKNVLRRASLRPGRADQNIQPLDVFLPDSIGGCYVDYIDLGKPTILVGYSVSLSLDAARDKCLPYIESRLASYNLDDVKFIYKYRRFAAGD